MKKEMMRSIMAESNFFLFEAIVTEPIISATKKLLPYHLYIAMTENRADTN